MNKEMFDIVDENDHPTGRLTTKEESHKKGYPHRVAAVLVFRENGKLLVQEHRLINRLLDHSVGGHVDAGETYYEAAVRETKEELGLEAKLEEVALGVPTPVKDPRPEFQNIIHTYGVYKTVVPDSWQFKETEEVDSLIEMDLGQAINLMNSHPERFLNGFFITLTAYLKHIGDNRKITAFGKSWGVL